MEDNKTFLGKAMIQAIGGFFFALLATSHESTLWSFIFGCTSLVWLAFANANFDRYERRG
jgi:hypothetical protein